MSVAREALAIVFREHAGMLGSFKDDKRKIMKRTEEILNECEDVVMEHMGEGRWEELVNLRENTPQRLQKITKTEETYVDTWFKHQKTYRKRQSDDRRNEARQLKRRRIKTQPDRIQQVLKMLSSQPGGFHFLPRPTTGRMLEIIDEIKELLPDIPWVLEPRWLEYPVHWLEDTHCRLARNEDY
jgi:hypothetical protein